MISAAAVGFLSAGVMFGVQAQAATPNVSLNLQLKQTLTSDASYDQTRVLVAGHSLYLPETSGVKVVAKNVDDNSTKWVFDPGDADQIYGLSYVDGVIYIRTMHSIYAVKDDQTTATLLWKKDNSYGNIAEDSNTLFAFSNGAVVALDPATMTNKWQYSIPGTVTVESGFTFGDGKVFFLGNDRSSMENEVFALDESTGQVLWTSNMAVSQSKLAYADGQLFVSTPSQMNVLNTADGSLKKSWANDQNFTFSINDQHLVIRSNQGNLKAYNLQTLQQEWQTTFSNNDGSFVDTTSRGPLFLSTQYALIENDGLIKYFDLSNGHQVRVIQNPGISMTPVDLEDNLLVTKDTNNNYYTYEPVTDTVAPTETLNSVTPRFYPVAGSSNAQIQFFLSEDSTVTVYVKNAPSTVVRVLNYVILNQGWNTKSWDGLDSQGQPATEGTYTYVFHLKDLSGKENWLEDPAMKTSLGDTYGTTVASTNVYSIDNPSQVISTQPTGTRLTIYGETSTNYMVTYTDSNGTTFKGLVSKTLLSTEHHPVTAPTDPTGTTTGTGSTSGTATGTTSQKIYTVASGDTLWLIASKNGTTTQALIDANHLDPSKYLYVGQQLVIPTTQSTPPPPIQPVQKTYTVQSGDTLWKIASANGTTTQDLFTANNLEPSKYLSVGQVLVIPSASSTTPKPPATAPTQKTYTVQSGDTLWKIASANGTTTQALIDLNKLDPRKYLYVGQKLLLP